MIGFTAEAGLTAPVVIGPAPQNSPWLALLPLALLPLSSAGAVLVEAARGRRVVLQDSSVFIDALKIWFPVIARRHETPRAAKRFVNHQRLLAMRLRRLSWKSSATLPESTPAAHACLLGADLGEGCSPHCPPPMP